MKQKVSTTDDDNRMRNSYKMDILTTDDMQDIVKICG